jgi:DNA-binding SARP family transcriptional activator
LRAKTYPLAWVCAALCGSALCYAYIDAADLAGGQALPTPDYWALFSLLLSLAAVYSIVYGRILDVRFVITRAALSAAIGCCSVGVFALLNLVFATQIARVSFIIPMEIVLAALIGFRFSGLQDVEAALNLVSVDAALARISGDRTGERDALTRALARAERTRNIGLIANVRAHAAFGEWFWGDDSEFQRHTGALAALVGNKHLRGIGRFTRSATGTFFERGPDRGELPDWTARTELVACGRANDSIEARQHAELAWPAAECSNDSFLMAIASVALAEFDLERRHGLYEDAERCCMEAGAIKILASIRAVAAGNEDLGMLEQFVNRRLRVQRGERPSLEIRFADASVRMCGATVYLRPREHAMLLLIALAPEGTSFDALSDQLWPDLDGDAAHNAMRVNLHRLRKALGDDAAIVRSATRYRVRRGSVVDMWTFQEILSSVTRARILTPKQRGQIDGVFQTLRGGKPRRPADQPWFYTIEQNIARLTREAGRFLGEDALRQGDYTRAIQIGTTLLDDDAADEIACEVVIRARLACGDTTGALSTYRDYREAIASIPFAQPSAKIEALVADVRANA